LVKETLFGKESKTQGLWVPSLEKSRIIRFFEDADGSLQGCVGRKKKPRQPTIIEEKKGTNKTGFFQTMPRRSEATRGEQGGIQPRPRTSQETLGLPRIENGIAKEKYLKKGTKIREKKGKFRGQKGFWPGEQVPRDCRKYLSGPGPSGS